MFKGQFETVEDILIHQAGYYGIPLKVALERIDRYLEKLGISDKRHTRARMLSGGMKRRLMIVRALIHEPKVLILDEPTSALGVKQSGVVLKRIVEARNQGLAVIFITHNPRHAFPVGNRFLILNRGRSMGSFAKDEIDVNDLTRLMSGGAELEALEHELRDSGATS